MTENNNNKPYLFIAIPAGGGSVENEFFISTLRLLQYCTDHKIPQRVEILPAGSYLPKMRDQLTARFMKHGKATHLLFLDSDISFTPEDVMRLVNHDVDIVAGGYTQKNDKGYFPINWDVDENNQLRVDKEKQLVSCKGVPTGFLLIKREVIEKMQAHYPELHYYVEGKELEEYGDQMYALFYPIMREHERDGKKRQFSEDLSFCIRWKDMGGDIWLDPVITLGHVGKKVYRRAPIEQLQEWRRMAEEERAKEAA